MLAELIQDMVMEKTIIHIPMLIGFPDSGLLDKLPKNYKSFKKEIEEKLTMLIKHARSITLKRKQYSLQEKFLDDVKIW